MANLLNVPVNIPWKLIAASRDMMDYAPFRTSTNEEIGPYPWRSSISVFVYEPDASELPPEICEEKITFLKVACSITGFQPSGDDVGDIVDYTRKINPAIGQILESYFACYGVLLSVSVFPGPLWDNIWDTPATSRFPHIIDFEPKRRDLYQAATESGEILTASRSNLHTDKSFTNTTSTESGVNVGAEVPLGTSGGGGGPKGMVGLSQSWGQTDQDSQTTSADLSRERREMQGSTTNLSQMYNLLSGYHVGTNRALFLMLPRPHTLQPTIRPTFVQGVREIEGIQEFFLVVSRPSDVESLCVQVSLETGHFAQIPEGESPTSDPAASYEYRTVEIGPIEAFILGNHAVAAGIGFVSSAVGGPEIRAEEALPVPPSGYHGFETGGWEFDPDRGDPGHGSIHQIKQSDDDATASHLDGYEYYTQSPDTVIISGTLFSTGWREMKVFHRKYEVYLRRKLDPGSEPVQEAQKARLLIARRILDTCIINEDGCLKSGKPPVEGDGLDLSDVREGGLEIVDETVIPGVGKAGVPFASTVQREMQRELTASYLRRAGRVQPRTFVETDFFKDVARRYLDDGRLARRVGDIEGIPEGTPESVSTLKVGEALDLSLRDLHLRHDLDPAEARALRSTLLGLPEAGKRGRQGQGANRPGNDQRGPEPKS